MAGVAKKHEIEAALSAESRDIASGKLKEDAPLDSSEGFRTLCLAARRGDLKQCQEQISLGVNINARDNFDYTPLILASLCGHYEVVQLLLESGALCERDTFQGERCLYNALNNRIRNLLLQYDYSKSTDPLQPLAGHITSLLSRDVPETRDISVVTEGGLGETRLHKFLLSARSPYFAKKLRDGPESTQWRLPSTIPSDSFLVAIKYLYLSERAIDLGATSDDVEEEILKGVDKISKHLEIDRLFDYILERGDRRLTRQRRQDEVARGQGQLDSWFRDNVIGHKIQVAADRADDVKWDRSNGIFADVLLQADEAADEQEEDLVQAQQAQAPREERQSQGLPIGNFNRSRSTSRQRPSRKSTLYPCHKAMLIRSEYFMTMFTSGFREAQQSAYLPIIPVACSPEVLEVVLTYLYTEKADFPLNIAVDVLFAGEMLFLEKLKARAALIISTLGSGGKSVVEADNSRGALAEDSGHEELDIYEIVRAGWDTRMHRLEEFGARYIADRLERFIDDPEFAELVKESAGRIKERQETDTVELIDDIRYYLSERFRLRFEDAGLEEMLEGDEAALNDEAAKANGDLSEGMGTETSETTQLKDAGNGGNFVQDLKGMGGVIRTLDGEEIDDEFAQDAISYQILLGKIDKLLDQLKLDA